MTRTTTNSAATPASSPQPPAGPDLADLAAGTNPADQAVPLPLKLFGVLCIVIGALVAVLCGAVAMFCILTIGAPDAEIKTASLVMLIAVMSVLAGLGALYFVLGVRLLKNNRRHAAALLRTIVALLVVDMVLDLMVSGPTAGILAPLTFIVASIALQSYLDPSLAEERHLQRSLRKLDERAAEEERIDRLQRLGDKIPYQLNFFNVFWTFVICSILGLIIEEIYHLVLFQEWQDRAGLLFGPFSPIYGVGAVLMTLALNGIRDKNPLIIFFASAVIGGAFEYFVSWFMQFAFGITAWDYSGTFLSIDGRTNGMFMFFWGVLGVVWVKFLLPPMFRLIYRIPWNWRYAVTGVATALMLVDATMTLQALDCWYERSSGQPVESGVQQFYAEHFDDDYMADRFQTMTMDPASATRVDKP